MNRTHLRFSAFSLILVLGTRLAGQAAIVRQRLPDSVYGFSLVDSTTFSERGTGYRYQNASGVHADVYVYSVPQELLSASDSAQLLSESRTFVAALAYGIERGHYDAYDVPVNHTVNVETNTGASVTGRGVVMVFRRGKDTFVSFMHLFVIDGTYLKVRLTLPSAEWRSSMDPNFAIELAKELFP